MSHFIRIGNDGASDFFWRVSPQEEHNKEKEQDKYRSDMGSVPGPKTA